MTHKSTTSLTAITGTSVDTSADSLPIYDASAGTTKKISPAELIANTSSFLQSGSGAQSRTVQAKLREVEFSVKDFGAVGDGVTNDLTAIRAAIAASTKSVHFPEGTYYVGTLGGSAAYKVFDLTSKGAGFRIHTQGKVLIKGATGANVEQSYFFYLGGNSDFYSDPIEFEDNVSGSAGVGGIGFNISADSAMKNLSFPSVKTTTCLGGIFCLGGNSTTRISGVHIGVLDSTTTDYPFNCQNNGDDVKIDLLTATSCLRTYFVYGAKNHDVNVFSKTPAASSAGVNISRSVGGLNTQNLKIRYVSRDGAVSNNSHILINHIDLLGGTISNIEIDADISASAAYYPLRFVNYSGGSESASASSNVVTDVNVRLICDSNANAIGTVATYTNTAGRVTIEGNANVDLDTGTATAFNHFALVWSSASNPQPAIGDSTVENVVRYANGRAYVSMTITFGASATYGTNAWSFTLPFTASETGIGSVFVFDNGTAFFTGSCRVSKGSNTLVCVQDGAGNTFTSALPMTWAATDQLFLNIEVPVLSVP